MVTGAKVRREVLAVSRKGELGGDGNMISAIFPLLVHRLLTSGPLDRLSSSSGGIHKRSLGFPSVVEPTYVWSRGKATLETQ